MYEKGVEVPEVLQVGDLNGLECWEAQSQTWGRHPVKIADFQLAQSGTFKMDKVHECLC